MRFRRVDIFSRVSRSPAATGVARTGGGEGGGAAGAAAGAAAATLSRTSGLLTTPPRPLPVTVATSMPASVAARRAAGEDLTPSPVAGVLAGVEPTLTGAVLGGAGLAGAAAAAPTIDSSKSARRSPTFTTAPSAAACFVITPARGAGTSTVILSVSSSTRVSPAATGSPSFFSQRETFASTIDSPSGGTFIWSIQE